MIFIKWLKHRLVAKGRHGTHSPFVYGFVENVLRNKIRYKNISGSFYDKDVTLFINSVICLKPEIIVADKHHFQLLSGIKKNEAISKFDDIILLESEEVYEHKDRFTLYIFEAKNFSTLINTSIFQDETAALLLHNPYKNKNKNSLLKNIVGTLSQQLFVLDYFHYILLFKSPQFKENQYFKIK